MQDYFKELDTAQFQAQYIIKRGATTGNLDLAIKAANGTRLLVTSFHVVNNEGTIGANRSCFFLIRDSDDDNIYKLASWTMTAGSDYSIPHQGNANNADNRGNIQLIPLINGDQIVFRGLSFAPNEGCTVTIRGYIRGRLPNIDTGLSSGVITFTNNYSRIV